MTIIDIVHTAYEDRPRLVATLRSHRLREQALEEGFTATQNLETSWVESHGQHGIPMTPSDEVRRRGQCRSTSVGDYARVVDTDGAESFWRCYAHGWRLIDSPDQINLVGQAAIRNGYGI